MVGKLLSSHSSMQTDYDIDISMDFLKYAANSRQNYYYFFNEHMHSPMEKANRFWNDDDNREWHLLNLRYFEDLHQSYKAGAPRWGSSTCYTFIHRQLIWKWFPKATFLMVMRDPRDHWCSYKHLHIVGTDDTDESAKWDKFVCHHKGLLPSRHEDPRIKFIEYHEVVRDPTMVYDMFELSVPENYLDNMLQVYLVRSLGGSGYNPVRELQNTNPMVTSRVGRWKNELSDEELRRCTEAFPELCKYYDRADV